MSGNLGKYDAGLISRNYGSISEYYFDAEVTNTTLAINNDNNNQEGNIKGKTTAEMRSKQTFQNWNFEGVWKIDEGETYPYFGWQKFDDHTSIKETKGINTLHIYPNPATTHISISCSIGDKITLFNSQGIILKQLSAKTSIEVIDLYQYNSGIYFIKVNNTTHKVIKK